MDVEALKKKLHAIRERIEAAKQRAGRTAEVRIVAVTKTHPPAVAGMALAAGFTALGENRVQELEAKVDALGRGEAEWHLIGHLQRNKVRRVLPLFDLIHSVDSLRLAEELSAEAVRAGLMVRGLVQVNTAGEESKFGFPPGEAMDAVAAICGLDGLRIEGLMTMAPYTDDEKVLRHAFGATRNLFEACGAAVPGFQATILSMGMSNDYEIAVEEGSTMVRLGTTLFGERAG